MEYESRQYSGYVDRVRKPLNSVVNAVNRYKEDLRRWKRSRRAERPHIIAAAIIDADGEVLSMPPPARHSTLIRASKYVAGKPCPQNVQGFIVSGGGYVGRAEALRIACEARQIDKGSLIGSVLTSEDLL